VPCAQRPFGQGSYQETDAGICLESVTIWEIFQSYVDYPECSAYVVL